MKLKIVMSACAMALAAATMTSGLLAGQVHAQTRNDAAAPVTLRSDVKIERTEQNADGTEKTALYTPNDVSVVPGDNVVFTLLVNNKGAEPAVGFTATNPMPTAVRFASVGEDWAEVSVDGGRSYGKLANLKVKTKDATGTAEVERAALPEDVTHIRWVFADAIVPGTERTVSYRGVVK
ncbi:hypothetical protein [Sphingorhabdus sp.]|uniref:hypothetical protein n=1 Tax=Sphingorhabdus sp. TaxID=1902408 RepID=UPI0039194C5A